MKAPIFYIKRYSKQSIQSIKIIKLPSTNYMNMNINIYIHLARSQQRLNQRQEDDESTTDEKILDLIIWLNTPIVVRLRFLRVTWLYIGLNHDWRWYVRFLSLLIALRWVLTWFRLTSCYILDCFQVSLVIIEVCLQLFFHLLYLTDQFLVVFCLYH